MNIRRHKHRPLTGPTSNGDDASSRLTASEVDELTDRADRLLSDLHAVMGEMSVRLVALTAAGTESLGSEGGSQHSEGEP